MSGKYTAADTEIPLRDIDLERHGGEVPAAIQQQRYPPPLNTGLLLPQDSNNNSNYSPVSLTSIRSEHDINRPRSNSGSDPFQPLQPPTAPLQNENQRAATSNHLFEESSSDDSSDSSDDELVELNQVVGSLDSKNITRELNRNATLKRETTNVPSPAAPVRASTINFRRQKPESDSEDSDDTDVDRQTSDTRSKRRRGHRHSLNEPKSDKKSSKHESKAAVYFRKVFLKIFHMSILFRCFFCWLPFALVLFVPLAVGAWGKKDATLGKVPLKWIFIWLEVAWSAIFVSRLVAHLMPTVFYFMCSIFAPRLKKYRTVIQAMEFPVTLVFSALIAVSTFMPVMTWKKNASKNDATDTWQKVVQNILVAILISSFVYCGERLLIHLISVSFHKKRFANRIKDNKHSIFVLSELLCAACVVFPPFSPEFVDEDMKLQSGKFYSSISDGKTTISKKIATNKSIQRFFGKFNHAVDAASSSFETPKENSPMNQETSEEVRAWCNNIVADAVNSKKLAETLAKRIWLSLVLEDEDALTMQDLKEVLGAEKKKDYEVVFQTLDADGNGDLTLDEMISSVKDISHERKSIYRSLKDVDTAIAKLHSVLLFIVFIITVIIFIGMLSPSVAAVLATLGTTILALSFVFSSTASELMASVVFLFVKHPIDVGDRVDILTVPYTVKEISLLSTVFIRVFDNTFVQAPNSVLNTLWIDNISRSGPQGYQFDLILGLPETTFDQLQAFNDKVSLFCEENSRDYCSDPFFYCTQYPDLDRVKLTINVVFRSNFADGILYSKRRNKLIRFIGRCINDLRLHVPRRDDTSTDPGLPFYHNSPQGGLPFNNVTREIQTLLDKEAERKVMQGPVGRRRKQDEMMETLREDRARMGFQDDVAQPAVPPAVAEEAAHDPFQDEKIAEDLSSPVRDHPKMSIYTSVIPEEDEEESDDERQKRAEKAAGDGSSVLAKMASNGSKTLERHGTVASKASGSLIQGVTTGRRRRESNATSTHTIPQM